jgi:hypothetical protein
MRYLSDGAAVTTPRPGGDDLVRTKISRLLLSMLIKELVDGDACKSESHAGNQADLADYRVSIDEQRRRTAGLWAHVLVPEGAPS